MLRGAAGKVPPLVACKDYARHNDETIPAQDGRAGGDRVPGRQGSRLCDPDQGQRENG